ncbi:MAG: FtsX-like permease family protein [Brevinematales bacterium]|nr:FtsX-like permease family protein [Brevinematales bacterium]
MKFLFIKIAFKNLFRHKAKSLIVGGLIFIVSLIMTIGGGVIKGMNAGLEKNVVNGFTGNIVIISTNQLEKEIFGSMFGRPTELLKDYSKIKEFLKQQDYIFDFLPAGRNLAMILTENRIPIFWLLFSVDIDEYQKFFGSNMIVIEGDFLKKDEKGVMVGTQQREYAATIFNYWFYPEGKEINYSNMRPKILTNKDNLEYKTEVVLLGMSDDYTQDMRIPIKAIIKFKNLNNFFGSFVFIDRKSFVEIFNYITQEYETKISEKEKKILKEENLDNILENDLFSSEEIGKASYREEEIKKAIKKTQKISYNTDAYNVILIKLKKGENEILALKKLNEELKKANLDAKAISWKEATPQLAQLIGMVQGTFSIIILLLFLVSLIVIMNTISMSVVERIPELGMMRAIGAQKNFIGRMIYLESIMLGLVFGGGGVISGAIISNIIAMLKLTVKNEMTQLIFGGEVFTPIVGAGDIIWNIIVLLIVLILAVVYPARLAKKVTPIEAVVRE